MRQSKVLKGPKFALAPLRRQHTPQANPQLSACHCDLRNTIYHAMEPTPLSSAEKKELRGIAQRLKPHLHVGRQGLSESVLSEIELALTKNGLIKLRFDADREGIRAFCAEIPEKTGCEYVGGVGKTAVFFRDMPEEA